MLSLYSPRWNELSGRSLPGDKFAEILAEYYAGPIPGLDELTEVLVECLCDGVVHDIAFAAAPHFVELSKHCSPESALSMLTTAASAVAAAFEQPDLPEDLRDPGLLERLNRDGIEIAQRLLEKTEPGTSDHLELHACLFAFSGNFDGYLAVMGEIESIQLSEWEIALAERKNRSKHAIGLNVQLFMDDPISWTSNGSGGI
jgi:hypothetical protein